MDIIEQLKYPFDKTVIHWRIGSRNRDKTKGMALAYLDARDVMKRLDTVCGARWQCRYSHHTAKGTICDIGIQIDGEWLWRADGAGDTDFEGTKGGMSDAFKRAAVRWGVGRYLYYLDAPWVEIDQHGNIKDKHSSAFNLPKWALPDPPLARLHALWAALDEIIEYVERIKEGIDCGDLSTAAEAYYALSDDHREAIHLAPTKGGVFTTTEMKVIKSSEFQQLRNAA